jgi:hypothetical protein
MELYEIFFGKKNQVFFVEMGHCSCLIFFCLCLYLALLLIFVLNSIY